MKPVKIWVLVADAARARLFTREGPGRDLVSVWNYDMIGANLPSRALTSDRPGRTFDRQDVGRHAIEPHTEPARHEKRRFAHDVAQRLDDERKKNALDNLTLVAPPQFLGDIRAEMPTALRRLVLAEVNKDLSKLRPADIAAHLDDVL